MKQSNPLISYKDIAQRLQQQFKFKSVTGQFMSGGVCPECNKKELFTDANEPRAVKCNRLNNCGYYESVRDLFPDLFENLTQKAPPTPEDPLATAKAYLNHVRGLNVDLIKGWFDQGVYVNPKNSLGTATVRFYLDKEKTRYWERLIDFKKGVFSAKAHFDGKRKPDGDFYKGDWWSPPGQTLDPMRPIYMVEGIFDTLALIEAGYQARSLMTCYNFPENELNNLDGSHVLIFALDNNPAGWSSAKKHVARAREMGFAAYAAFPESELDWNDLLKRDGYGGLKTHMDKALWKGARMVSKNVKEAAALYIMQTRSEHRVLQHNNALWEAKYDTRELVKRVGQADDEAGHSILNSYLERDIFENLTDAGFTKDVMSVIKLIKLSNCVPKFVYQQVDQYNDEARLNYFEVSYENGSPKSTISIPGTALADAGGFNQALLKNTPGARFMGGKKHIEHLHERHWFYKPAKEVKTVAFVGYDKKSKTYVFNDTAFHQGKRHPLNKQGFFDIRRNAIKTVNQDVQLKIAQSFNAKRFMKHFEGAYQSRGLIVLSWWVGTMFAEQLRFHFQGYPFFELQGQASSGKSTLIKILWKLFGREGYEGFNPLNSSFSAIDRNFAKTSNMPVVLIESDANDEQRNAKKFNWEHLKNAYTGEPLKERGVQNAGNETVFNPFRAALMAAQNTAIEGSEAILSRFVHLPLDRTHHVAGGKFHAETLARMEVEELSGFLPYILKHEKAFIESVIEKMPAHFVGLDELNIRIDRIRDNHAIVMAILETLIDKALLPINPELAFEAFNILRQRAAKRQLDTQIDHPEVQALWDIFEYTNIQPSHDQMFDKQILNHSKNPDKEIALNLVHFEQVCKERQMKAPDMREVKRHIKKTHAHKFKEYKSVSSNITNKTVRCYVFDVKK